MQQPQLFCLLVAGGLLAEICNQHQGRVRHCWVRCTHCSNYEARVASGNYKARGASGNYEARGASGDYKARGASGGKHEARMVIFCILAAVNGFSWISWKEESH
jgi:hypothetical protein